MPHQGCHHRTSPSADADLLLSLAGGRALASPPSPGNSILARHRPASVMNNTSDRVSHRNSSSDHLHHPHEESCSHHHSIAAAVTTPSPLALPGGGHHSSSSSSSCASSAVAAAAASSNNMHMSVHGNGSHRLMPSPIKLPPEEEEQPMHTATMEKRAKRTVATDDIEEPSPESTSRKIRRMRSPPQEHVHKDDSDQNNNNNNTVISPASSVEHKSPESKPSPSHNHHHHHHPAMHHPAAMPYRPPYYTHWPYPYTMHPPPPYYAMPPHPEYTNHQHQHHPSTRTSTTKPAKEEQPRHIGDDARCVPLEHPTHSRKVVSRPEDYDLKLPDFPQLVNFPEHLTRGQTRGSGEAPGPAPNGQRHCVMCGLLRISSSTANRVNRSNAPASAADSTVHIIPRQNKGVCTACDVTVWIMNTAVDKSEYPEEDLEIKWCKGCKNFRPWPAFGDKGLATKCARCRHRQRTKYAQAKRTGPHRDATNRYEHYPPEDDIMAAQGLSNLSQQQVP